MTRLPAFGRSISIAYTFAVLGPALILYVNLNPLSSVNSTKFPLLTSTIKCGQQKIIKHTVIKKAIGISENNTSLINKNNLEIKNLFSKLGIFLIG